VPEEPYLWEVRLWSRNPAKLVGILIACVVAGTAGYFLFNQILFGLIGFCVIAIATAEYWLPQKYRLDNNGASSRCGISVSAISWNDVKRVIYDPEGVKLSPLAQDGRLSAFRGVYLRFADNQEEVQKRIDEIRSAGDGPLEG
jgi:hypothetical protein